MLLKPASKTNLKTAESNILIEYDTFITHGGEKAKHKATSMLN